MSGTQIRLVALIVMAGASLAACGTARYTPPATGHSSPPAGNRAQALRLARDMLSKVVLPPGARRYTGPLPPMIRQAGGMVGTELASEHMAWQTPGSMRSSTKFLQGHVPAGMTATGRGQTSDPSGPLAEEVDFAPHSVPAGIDSSELIFQIAAGAHGGSVIRADAKVSWYPRRSAAERVSAETHIVIVTARYLDSRPHTVTRTVTDPAVIARLAALLNGLHAALNGPRSCPAITTSYTLAFSAAPGTRPYLIASMTSCGVIGVTANGRAQPGLDDHLGRVFDMVAGLLKGRA
jgi:hypothetical protein